jgi:hypothetical protein
MSKAVWRRDDPLRKRVVFHIKRKAFMALVMMSLALTMAFWIRIGLTVNIYNAALITILLSPFIWVLIGVPLSGLHVFAVKRPGWVTGRHYDLLYIGIMLGMSSTFIALMIGHITDPSAHVPQTFQMLISNMIFDGLTMVATFWILNKALAQNAMFRLPVAIFLDIIVAAILACGVPLFWISIY